MSKKLGILMLVASVALLGCDEVEDQVSDVEGNDLYTQTMCNNPVVTAEDDIAKNAVIDALTNDASFAEYVEGFCNTKYPDSIRLDISSFNLADEIPINGNSDTVTKAYLQVPLRNYPTTNSSLYDELKFVPMDLNENNGVIKSSRIIGTYAGYYFDIIFQQQSGWVNTQILLPKAYINSGAGLQTSNFDDSVNPNTPFINALVANQSGDFKDMVYSYCSNFSNASFLLYHNDSDLSTINGNNVVKDNTSTISSLSQSVGAETYTAENIEITVTPANKISFMYDVRDNIGTVFTQNILKCN